MSTYIFKPDPFSSHSKIAKIIRELLPCGSSILDLGCNQGFLGRILGKEDFYLVGVDIDREALKKAKNYYQKVLRLDLESEELRLGRVFKAVVMADVLEHVVEPESLLRKVKSCLAPSGFIILSVPNIANFWIRLSLLLGHFEYQDCGILDRTHLRFFTKRSTTELVKKAGYKLQRMETTPIPLPLLFPSVFKMKGPFLVHHFNNFLVRLRPTLLAYQFIIVARP